MQDNIMLILLSAVSWQNEAISVTMISQVLLLRPTEYKWIKKPHYLGDIFSLLFQATETTLTI